MVKIDEPASVDPNYVDTAQLTRLVAQGICTLRCNYMKRIPDGEVKCGAVGMKAELGNREGTLSVRCKDHPLP